MPSIRLNSLNYKDPRGLQSWTGNDVSLEVNSTLGVWTVEVNVCNFFLGNGSRVLRWNGGPGGKMWGHMQMRLSCYFKRRRFLAYYGRRFLFYCACAGIQTTRLTTCVEYGRNQEAFQKAQFLRCRNPNVVSRNCCWKRNSALKITKCHNNKE